MAKNSSGEEVAIVALIKTQGSDTKLVAQMQPYYEAKGQPPRTVGGVRVPPIVTQIGDGENGGVMMNEFPSGYRQAVRQNRDRQSLTRSLEDVLKAYTTVLDTDGTNADAAYNYEFVARLRSALAGGRTSGAPPEPSRNMQGEKGEPPKGTPKSEFNVIVPMRPDERQEQVDPGAGIDFQRKG